MDDIEKIPKKRGRKPKEKIYSVKELPKTFFEENKNEAYILHLPIKSMDKKSNSPLPNNMNNDYSIYNESIDNYDLNTKNLLLTQTDLLNNNLFENNSMKDDVHRPVLQNCVRHADEFYCTILSYGGFRYLLHTRLQRSDI